MRNYKAAHQGELAAYNKTYHQMWYMLKRYNFTVQQWEAMFEGQGRCCAICKSPDPRNTNGWQLDHDHACCPGKTSCGKCIRGILCQGCNTALGAVRDSIDCLKTMVCYLENSRP